jgi:hypothetical protein
VILGLIPILLQIISFIVRYRASSKTLPEINFSMQLQDDEEEEIAKFWSNEAWNFLVPKRNLFTIIISSLLSGLLGAGMIWYLQPSQTLKR